MKTYNQIHIDKYKKLFGSSYKKILKLPEECPEELYINEKLPKTFLEKIRLNIIFKFKLIISKIKSLFKSKEILSKDYNLLLKEEVLYNTTTNYTSPVLLKELGLEELKLEYVLKNIKLIKENEFKNIRIDEILTKIKNKKVKEIIIEYYKNTFAGMCCAHCIYWETFGFINKPEDIFRLTYFPYPCIEVLPINGKCIYHDTQRMSNFSVCINGADTSQPLRLVEKFL